MTTKSDREKVAIGHFGEQAIASNLERIGWEVSVPILGGNIDLTISRYFCVGECKEPTRLWKLQQNNDGYRLQQQNTRHKAVLDKCEKCKEKTVRKQVRFIQVKASTGKDKGNKGIDFSFHPKLRYHADPRTFYVWMAIFHDYGEPLENSQFYTYIFHGDDVNKFDNIGLDSYQRTDNQQIHLYIDKETGQVTNSPSRYSCFHDEFLNAWDKLDRIIKIDGFGFYHK